MPSSAKVQFNLEELKVRALESIDERIAAKGRELEAQNDDTALQADIADWREKEEARLRQLVSDMDQGEVDNHRLVSYSVRPIPKRDSWERSRLQTELSQLEATKSKMLAKTGSLVPDENGNVSLTSTQLKDFFGL